MKYLVMEVHPAYAVVLDEEGRFLKAANLRYQVGDTVPSIVELRTPHKAAPALWKPLSGFAGLAACLCLVFFGYYQPNYTAYGTLRIQINPDVEMTVSRTDRALDLDGLNADGEDLIEGYSYQGKNRETAANELVERAIHMGFLSDGDTISITVSSDDADWQAQEEAQIQAQLEERYGETIVIQLGGDTQQQPAPTPADDAEEVVIPVAPTPDPTEEEAAPDSGSAGVTAGSGAGSRPNTNGATGNTNTGQRPNAGGAANDDDTDYGPSADGVTGYDDTDYGPNADGVTNYDDTDYGPSADGVTDYENTDYGPNSDGITNYGDTDYGPYTDGITDYEDRGDDDDDGQDNDDDQDDDDGDSQDTDDDRDDDGDD